MVARVLADGVADIFRESAKRVTASSVNLPVSKQAVSIPVVSVNDVDTGSLYSAQLGVPTPVRSQGGTEIRRLVTLDDHQRLLAKVLSDARWRVIIVSPQISAGAIRADSIHSQIERTVARGVEVIVLTDNSLNLETNGEGKSSYLEGRRMLEEAGAQLMVLNGIHYKCLIADNSLITDGSFNWLSAVRKEGHSHCREERTEVTTGYAANMFIDVELKRIKGLAVISSTRVLRSSVEPSLTS